MSVILFFLLSCRHSPPPPAGMTGNEHAEAYLAAENEYEGLWMADHSSLLNKIKKELDEHALALPKGRGPVNDSVLEAAVPWKILVKNAKEVHAISNAGGKSIDHIIYTETDPAFKVSLKASDSKTYIFIISCSGKSSEIRVLPFSCNNLKPLLMQERKPGVIYSAEHFGGNNTWILSNDNAPRRTLLIAPDMNPVSSRWKAAVKENDSLFIDNYKLIDLKYLVLVQRRNLSTSIQITGIYEKNDKEAPIENVINFPEPEGRITGLTYDSKEDKLVFIYSSIITPPTCYTYGIHSMHLGIRWKKQLKDYVQDDYKAEVVWASGNDNLKVPVSVLLKREIEKPESDRPLLLFIDSENRECRESCFTPELLSLLNRGFCIARVHLPATGLKIAEASDMVAKTISALAEKKLAQTGMITLLGKGNDALIAIGAINKNPVWMKTLVLCSPAYEENIVTTPAPDTYIFIDPEDQDKGLPGLKMGSEIRKRLKPENTMLMKNKSVQDQDFTPGLITFILISNGIQK
jgi:hypothetical protein